MNEDLQNAINVCCGPSHEIVRQIRGELLHGAFGIGLPVYGRTFMFSDWSGEHQDAAYQTLSVLLCDAVSLARWVPTQDGRKSAGRTMSYKKLNGDVLRRLDLEPFLTSTQNLRGVLVNVAFHSHVQTAFAPPSDPTLRAGYDRDKSWFPPHVFEKFVRNIDIAGYLAAILVSHASELIYVLDDDACVDTPERQEVFGRALRTMISLTTSKPPGRIRISTVRECGFTEDAELACAIPDLSAGGLSDAFVSLLPNGAQDAPKVAQLLPEFERPKVDCLLRWLRSGAGLLQKFTFIVSPVNDGKLLVSRFHSFNAGLPTILLPPTHQEGRMRRNR